MKRQHDLGALFLLFLFTSLSANAVSVTANLGPVTVGWTEGSAPTVAANSEADDWLKILLVVLANQSKATESTPAVSIEDLFKPKTRTVADCANELANCSRGAAWEQSEHVKGEVYGCTTEYSSCVASVEPLAGL